MFYELCFDKNYNSKLIKAFFSLWSASIKLIYNFVAENYNRVTIKHFQAEYFHIDRKSSGEVYFKVSIMQKSGNYTFCNYFNMYNILNIDITF